MTDSSRTKKEEHRIRAYAPQTEQDECLEELLRHVDLMDEQLGWVSRVVHALCQENTDIRRRLDEQKLYIRGLCISFGIYLGIILFIVLRVI